jgi:prepilin-type processing-associated H-X9-DG protein
MEVPNLNPGGGKPSHGFTRLELLACLTGLALLTNVIATGLVTSAGRGDRAACFNNLRQIGVGYAQFASEHDQQTAWRVRLSEGGNLEHPLKNNSFIQFSVLSNFIGSPRVLIDPAEDRPTARIATEWSASLQGGLLHPNFGNNSVSYFLGLDGNFTTPASLFSGDRNLRLGDFEGCASGITPAANFAPRFSPNLSRPAPAWTNGAHGLSGNILFYDGSVQGLDTPGLHRMITVRDVAGGGGVGAGHVLVPF